MSNTRWSSDDKIELMKLYSDGKSFDDISKVLGRSANAIKLRLESIVYDNLARGKKMSMMTKMLNTDEDTIKQFYYSHKSFKQGRGEDVVDVDFSTNNPTNNDKLINSILGESNIKGINHNKPFRDVNRISTHDGQSGGEDDRHRTVPKKGKTMKGGDVTDDKNLQRIESENKVLEEIIKNYKMKRQVKKLYVDGKLDKKSVTIYEKLLNRSKD
jgi:hypothetical protein